VENTYEMHLLSKTILDDLKSDPDNKHLALDEKEISFFLRDPLYVELSEYKLIIVDYNNKNMMFNELLQQKIEREVKPDTIIVKIFNNFEENTKLKLLKVKFLRNFENKKDFMVFFYKKQ
jgi:hypothetical protein